ncbi:MAG: HDOD domain-containing protein [Fimbriimonadaceae bacterium]
MSAVPIENRPDPISAVLDASKDLAVLPQVVFKIMELTDSAASSAGQMERAIVVDPGFSAKVLRQANSAYYALPRKITSIREAIVFLGFKSVRQLAMAVGVFDMFVGKNDRESLRRRAWWRHSLDTAVCCRVVADMLPGVDPDEAYTCGLLHYIGKPLLDRFNPKSYEKVQVLLEAGAGDVQAETAVFHCHHGQVSEAITHKWGFPEMLVGGMNYLAEPDPQDESGDLRATTALSDKISLGCQSGFLDEDIVEMLPAWTVERLKLTPEKLPVLVARGQGAIEAAAKMSI